MAKQRICDNCGTGIEEGGAGCSDGPPMRVRVQPPHNGKGIEAHIDVIGFRGSVENAEKDEGARGITTRIDICPKCVCQAFHAKAKINRWEF